MKKGSKNMIFNKNFYSVIYSSFIPYARWRRRQALALSKPRGLPPSSSYVVLVRMVKNYIKGTSGGKGLGYPLLTQSLMRLMVTGAWDSARQAYQQTSQSISPNLSGEYSV